MTNEVVPYEQRIGALTAGDVRAQVNLIQHIMREVMKGPTKDNPEGVHYGIIPGTGKKPTLLKAGAEKLLLTFRMDPQYEITERQDGAHYTVVSKCILYHIETGKRLGSGMGSCSSRESKYAYRQANRKCPNCGAEAIIKGKDFKGDGRPTGWVCFSKKGGCGQKFKDGDKAIEAQATGRVPNEDLADQYNTVLKIANKRSLVAAVLNATAASDIFTQDIEDEPRDMGRAEVVDSDGVITNAEASAIGAHGSELDEATGDTRPRSTPSAPASSAPHTRDNVVSAQSYVTISADQHIAIMDLLREYDIKAERACKAWKVSSVSLLAADQYERAMQWIERAHNTEMAGQG